MKSGVIPRAAGVMLLSNALLSGCSGPRSASDMVSEARGVVEMDRYSAGSYLGLVDEVRTGGQSGVDQACMAHAIASGVPVGGWVPAGFTAEVYSSGLYHDQSGGIPIDLLARGNFIETTETNVLAFIENQSEELRSLLEPLIEKVQKNPADPSIRTELQVVTTDGTLIITTDSPRLTDGTVIMEGLAKKYEKPYFIITVSTEDLVPQEQIADARVWLTVHNIHSLNIGGPRASHEKDFGLAISQVATQVLDELFRE
ncbi:MAG: hypothetical protein KDD64_02140 [Bdellovibrionales bacterium]|nr:hypothetical protein [Bdellovibrionales bacterium]